MKKMHVFVWLLMGLTLSLSAPEAGAAGGMASGGSSIIKRAAPLGPLLLDLFIRRPDFIDKHRLPEMKLEDAIIPGHSTLLPRIDVTKLPSYQFALKRLEIWKENSPKLIPLLEAVLPIMHFSYAEHIPGLPKGFVVPEELLSLARAFDLVPLVYYDPAWGAMISAAEWGPLGDYTHSGSLIHEGGRDLVGNYGLTFKECKGSVACSLEEIVGRIMLETPTVDSPILQGPNYISYLPDLTVLSSKAEEQTSSEEP